MWTDRVAINYVYENREDVNKTTSNDRLRRTFRCDR